MTRLIVVSVITQTPWLPRDDDLRSENVNINSIIEGLKEVLKSGPGCTFHDPPPHSGPAGGNNFKNIFVFKIICFLNFFWLKCADFVRRERIYMKKEKVIKKIC